VTNSGRVELTVESTQQYNTATADLLSCCYMPTVVTFVFLGGRTWI